MQQTMNTWIWNISDTMTIINIVALLPSAIVSISSKIYHNCSLYTSLHNILSLVHYYLPYIDIQYYVSLFMDLLIKNTAWTKDWTVYACNTVAEKKKSQYKSKYDLRFPFSMQKLFLNSWAVACNKWYSKSHTMISMSSLLNQVFKNSIKTSDISFFFK